MAGQVQGTDPAQESTDFDQNPVAQVDTQQTQQPTTPTNDVSGHVGAEQQQPSPDGSAGDHQTEQPDEATVQAALREYGKLSQVQKELADKNREVDRLRNIENRAMRSPEDYKWALMKFNDLSEEDANSEVERMKMQGAWQQAAPQQSQQGQQTQQQTLDPRTIDQLLEQKLQQRDQTKALQDSFFDRVPELDPKTIAPERRKSVGTLVAAIEYEARRRISENSSLNLVDELVNVYKEYTGKTDEQLEAAREQGKREGYLEANANKAAVSQPAKGFTNRESTYGLSAEEIRQAKEEGYSPEEFARLKNPVSEVG